MQKNIKRIIVLLIVLGLVILLYLLTTGGSPENQNPKPQDVSPAPIINNSKGNLPVNIPTPIQTNIPKELPLLTFQIQRLSNEHYQEVATNLGYTLAPTKIVDVVEGTKLLWSNDTSSLWVSPNLGYLKYSLSQYPEKVQNQRLSEEEYKKKASDLISGKLKLDSNTIKVATVDYFRKSSDSHDAVFVGGTISNASIIQVNFTYKDAEYPILTQLPEFQIIFVQMLPNGDVYRTEAYQIQKISKTANSYPLKNMDDIENSLSAAKLISLDSEDYKDLSEINFDDIKNIDINKIEVGYLFDSSSSSRTLSPVFLLSGKINIQGLRANQARLYMTAFK